MRLPLGGQLGLRAQRRDHRVGHRDRAADPGLGLGEAHEGGAAGDVGAGPRVAPGGAVQLVFHRGPEQLVPGGVELDLVDAVAVAVVGLQLRPVLVGEPSQLLRLGRAGELADRGDPLASPSRRPRGRPPRPATRVGLEDVVVGQRRRLVGDGVVAEGLALPGCHRERLCRLAGRHDVRAAEAPDR